MHYLINNKQKQFSHALFSNITKTAEKNHNSVGITVDIYSCTCTDIVPGVELEGILAHWLVQLLSPP